MAGGCAVGSEAWALAVATVAALTGEIRSPRFHCCLRNQLGWIGGSDGIFKSTPARWLERLFRVVEVSRWNGRGGKNSCRQRWRETRW